MIEQDEIKESLSKLIPFILNNEKNLKDFVFFVNVIENLKIPTEEIEHVLNDFLCIVTDKPVKGRYRVRIFGDRHILKCKENIGFLDATKIVIIAKAVRDKTAVSLPISIHAFKRKYIKHLQRNNEEGKDYRELLKRYQEGDDIFEIVSSCPAGENVNTKSSIIMKRNAENIVAIQKILKDN